MWQQRCHNSFASFYPQLVALSHIIERLRISNLNHTLVKYADIIGGNSVQKVTLEWEDENCWIVLWLVGDSDSVYDMPNLGNSYQYYQYIDKNTFETRNMTLQEVKDFKKAHKN